MSIPEDGYLLRIFVGESDRHGHRPLYESIVLQAREAGLAGATVLRGVMGFGKHSILHTAKILRLSEAKFGCMPMVLRNTASGIAAHSPFGTIGIEHAHPKVGGWIFRREN